MTSHNVLQVVAALVALSHWLISPSAQALSSSSLLCVLVATATIALCSAANMFVGKCKTSVKDSNPVINITPDPAFSNEFFQGQWKTVFSPETDAKSPFKNVRSYFTEENGSYKQTEVYIEDGKEEDGPGLRFTPVTGTPGKFSISGKISSPDTIIFLKYKPGAYAYYYACSEDGGSKTDRRFVLVPVGRGGITTGDKKEIDEVDKTKYQFNGPLTAYTNGVLIFEDHVLEGIAMTLNKGK